MDESLPGNPAQQGHDSGEEGRGNGPREPVDGCRFCCVPYENLREIARLRYSEQVPTLELLKKASTPEDKELVLSVALLHLAASALGRGIISANVEAHALRCRERVLDRLREDGIIVDVLED